MKSNAPWSVKGIERDARETAKEAARREGMTVGEWLNQMIYSQAEGGAPQALSDSEVEGLRLRDIVTAIEHLRNRVVDAEANHAAAVSELTRNMGGFVERVQRLERVKPAEGTHQDIAQRLEKLERAGGDRHRIEALKALEKAVAQVAIQFNNAQRTTLNRLDSAEQQLQEFAERIDRVGDGGEARADMGPLRTAIEGLAERVARAERIAQEAASLKTAAADSSDPEFVERTGARLRVLGDEIKRGGDQIRALEGTITKLSGQIEAAEKRSADGVQKVSETIAEVRTQLLADSDAGQGAPDVEAILAAARAETEDKLTALQRSLDEMSARFETLEQGATSARAEAAPVAEDAETVDDDETAAIAAEIEQAVEAAANDGDPDIDDVIDEIEDAVAAIEPGDDAAEEDPFAFADEIEETADAEELADEDDPVEDFSFQLDDETGDDEDSADDDITVSADESEVAESPVSEAQSLLAEVRNALSGAGADEAEDDELDATLEEPAADHEDDEDEQAPNTASLAPSLASEAEETPPATAAPKEDLVQAARRRAREAAARNAEEQAQQPRRMQLSAKQRAILAARARQKRAEQEVVETDDADDVAEEKPTLKLADPAPETAAEPEETDEEAEGGRFAKITAALASARALLGRNKSEKSAEIDAAHEPGIIPALPEDDEPRRRNVDRAALESIRANASVRPLTIALGAAILLAVAALIYLVKDFVFPPDDGARPTPAISQPSPATNDAETAAIDSTPDELPVVPQAPAIDPQAVYLASMEALSAASTEDSAMAAIGKLQEAAALGYPPAQLQLGELFKTGQGVEQDLGQARVWFRRAANGGNVLAMHRIGVMTARGDGGAADPQEAIAWFEQAANFGLVDSQYNLGAIFHPSTDGPSAVQDAGKAYYWYALAARNGDDQAQPLAAGVAVALSPQQRAEIEARVAAWKAAPADENANLNASAG